LPNKFKRNYRNKILHSKNFSTFFKVLKMFSFISTSLIISLSKYSNCLTTSNISQFSTFPKMSKWPFLQNQNPVIWWCLLNLFVFLFICLPIYTGSHFEAQADLKLMIHLPPTPQCCDS
jgi:hypothetical protein